MRTRKAALVETLLPRLRVALPPEGSLDPATLFAEPRPGFWMEIGFGGGEHLAAQAARNPSVGFIGCEPFLNGVAGLLDHAERLGLTNIRVHDGDARLLLDVLPAACLDRAYLLFPDPWPKKRHEERRFLGPAALDRLARALKPGGLLHVATDVPPLADWMRRHIATHASFALERDGPAPFDDHLPTRYEQKARAAGRAPVYIAARRRSLLIEP